MKFLRQDGNRFSRLGKGRKKLQKWRRSKGKHSKMRKKRGSYPAKPSPGYKSPSSTYGRIKGLIPILVHNLKELENLSKDNIAVIAKIGAKKKFELIKKAAELKVRIFNVKQEAK